MKRGVWWADLPPPVGSRPVVILIRDAVLHSIESVVVVLVTRTVRGIPTEVALGGSCAAVHPEASTKGICWADVGVNRRRDRKAAACSCGLGREPM